MRRRIRPALTIAFLLVLTALGLFLWQTSSRLLTPTRHPLEERHRHQLERPSEFGLALEPLRVTTPDGIELAGFIATLASNPGKAEKARRMAERLGTTLTPPPSAAGTVFILHGRSGRKEDMLAIAERFVAGGFRCVVYDARCHGQSGGTACTFGHRETADFRAVLDHVEALLTSRREVPGPVCGVGVSLGGSVLLQALSAEPRLRAVVAVAPFATLPEVIHHSARRTLHSRIPTWLVAASLRTGGWRAGFDPYSISPLRGLAASAKPVFLVHGALDEVIPLEHAKRLELASAGRARLHVVPDGGHGNVLARGGDALYADMIKFFLAATTPGR